MGRRSWWWMERAIRRQGRYGVCRCWEAHRDGWEMQPGIPRAWSADGKQMAYANGADVFIANVDGTGARKIATMKNLVSGLAISPDDTEVRVETEEISQSGTSVVVGERTMWSVSAKGSNPQPLIAEWPNTRNECCGRWTEMGSTSSSSPRARSGLCRAAASIPQKSAKPIQLTSSPMQLQSPLPSRGREEAVCGGDDISRRADELRCEDGQAFARSWAGFQRTGWRRRAMASRLSMCRIRRAIYGRAMRMERIACN